MERKSLIFLKLGILFLFMNFSIGNLDLLPDFAGMLFLFASLASHGEQTETEKRMKPLLLVLAADYFLHWIIRFSNPIEGLIANVISVYVIFMLMGEVSTRIWDSQMERARHLNFARVGIVLLLTVSDLLAAYGNQTINGALTVCFLIMLIFLMAEVCLIRPENEA